MTRIFCLGFLAIGVLQAAPEPKNIVRYIYLVSADKEPNDQYIKAIDHAAREMREWYGKQLGGATFTLADPVVEVIRSDKPAAWFNSQPNRGREADRGFRNSLDEMKRLRNVRPGKDSSTWVIYSDGAGNNGRAIKGFAYMPEDDLRGLIGQHPTQKSVNRWIAGMGHELGHAFGLPHPKDTVKHRDALMWAGIYGKYPDGGAYLTDEDKKTLLKSPFIRKPDATGESVRVHGATSTVPAKRWEDAFVSGNGRMGAMLFGNPSNDTLVANHCRLFLPQGNREIVPDLAKYLPEFRKLIRDRGYDVANEFLITKAKEQGYPGIIPTDPFHPGFFVKIVQPEAGPISDYKRTEDFRTGEVTVSWRDPRGEFSRRMFVSRAENLIVFSQTGPVACELEFPALGQALIKSTQETSPKWVTYHNTYAKGKGGYDAVARVVRSNEGRDVLMLMRIVPWKTPLPKDLSEAWAYSPENPDFERTGVFNPVPKLAESSVVAYHTNDEAKALLPQLKGSLASVDANYAALLKPHAQAHAALFDRVTLDLNGGAARGMTSEALLQLAKTEDRLPAALMEKMYDAGRYMLICSAGEMLPNLHGIWTGTWKPEWSGDFTLDTNVQAALAAACSANLPELLEGYFRTMESFYPEWRLNAERMYGCRGFLTNPRASNTALELHWEKWPGHCWTPGCGWLASFFTQYAQYTGDREFLEKRCLPLLKEVALFYEDFLSETDKNGKLVFIPSYNAETGCGINATMDVAVARDVLGSLITACRELNVESENLPKWERMLSRLPDYPISEDGAIPEFPGGEVLGKHRHHSQLYGCFQSFDPVFETNAILRAAAKKTVLAKIAGSDGGGEQSSFGRIQAGISAAYLGQSEQALDRLEVLAVKRSMNPSLMTSHEPAGEIFNTDANGGIPQVVNTMLLFSRPGQIDLLPALPAAWPNGAIKGLRANGGFEVDVEWRDNKLVSAHIRSLLGKAVRVRLGDMAIELTLKKGDSVTLNGRLEVTSNQ